MPGKRVNGGLSLVLISTLPVSLNGTAWGNKHSPSTPGKSGESPNVMDGSAVKCNTPGYGFLECCENRNPRWQNMMNRGEMFSKLSVGSSSTYRPPSTTPLESNTAQIHPPTVEVARWLKRNPQVGSFCGPWGRSGVDRRACSGRPLGWKKPTHRWLYR